MPQVSVIVPSWKYWKNPLKLQPLWEMYYATFIDSRFADFEVDIVDLREYGGHQRGSGIQEQDVYFYWIMKSADAHEIYGVVEQLRGAFPASVHIAGGNHVDHHPKQCTQIFDAIVLGTAEELVVKALQEWQAGELKSLYKTDEVYPFCNYPHPLRHYLPSHRIVNREHFSQYGGVVGTGVYFSRGCGFKCNFCVYNNPGSFEYRTPNQIATEIEYLKTTYGVEGVNLRDEVCIPVNPRIARGYLEAIGHGGVLWRGQTIPMGSEEMVKLAAESGCQELALGIESVDSDAVLHISNKPSKSIENNRRYIEMLKKAGIKVKICLIFGLPGESNRVLEKTIDFLEETEPDYVAVSGFDPVPGSPFFKKAEAYGIKNIDGDFSKHSHLLFRFGEDEDEDVGLPFEYEAETPYGPGRTRGDIVSDLQAIQSYLRENNMCY